MKLNNVITIDGPVASGKTTVGKKLAEMLDLQFLDTGVMYRAVALAVVEAGIDPHNEERVSEKAENIQIEIFSPSQDDGRQYDVFVDGKDATWKLREDVVRDNVSLVSTYQRVRRALTQKQREIGERGKIVMVGRDIGTVVLPDAAYKFFLVASVEERARRRYLEDKASGKKVDLADIQHSLEERDKVDSSRKLAPLKPAEDAVVISTDHKTVDEVVEEILSFIKE
ncbi:MAG TPA: (d)CMP kinase [Anaerolineaceae bacterium]|uniref:Cytidylate kinase n=1 Tax=Anaerolinea thermophila TaxID=167964 RepID=A0A101FY55_9CHLR|nr:MAG: Cytidylate kinase [Anaerolinea thermophila]HAF62404.1 (d)CMP kinase [Anaerolineaceae bacterium]